MGSNPVGASEFFLGFICNCLNYFTTAKISFTSILCSQFTHDIYHMHFTSWMILLFTSLSIPTHMSMYSQFTDGLAMITAGTAF